MTQEEYFAYEARFKHILDEESWEYEKQLLEQEKKSWKHEKKLREQELERKQEELTQREKEAKVKAKIQKAEEKQKVTARKLLSMGMDIEDTVKATELSKEEVIEIQKEL